MLRYEQIRFEEHVVVCRNVRKLIGPFAAPDVVHYAPTLPKTRSGKIMRRILRKVATGDTAHLGDTSTLLDPSAVTSLVSQLPPSAVKAKM